MARRKKQPNPDVEARREWLAGKLMAAELDLGRMSYAYWRARDLFIEGAEEVRFQDLDDRMNEIGVLMKRLRELA